MKSSFCRAVLGVAAVSLAMVGGAAAVCENPIRHKLVLETSSSLGVPAQVRVATTADELKSILRALGIGPTISGHINFKGVHALVVVGAPRTNGCRATEFLCVQAGSHGASAEAVIKETSPGCGCICTQVFTGNAVFVVVVPDYVTDADLVSLTSTFNCESCGNCPVTQPRPETIGEESGNVIFEPAPNCP